MMDDHGRSQQARPIELVDKQEGHLFKKGIFELILLKLTIAQSFAKWA
jgi:hypothetical protein